MKAGSTGAEPSADTQAESISPFTRILVGILFSCLVTAGAAVVVAVVIAILDLYLSGHSMEPPHWHVIREWLFRGCLVAVFLTTLLVRLKGAPDRP